MIKVFGLQLIAFMMMHVSNAQMVIAPDKLYGQLFKDVQLQKIFPDGKTFVDCVPKRNVKDIMYDYGMMKGPKMDLKKFVEDNFTLPKPPPQLNYIQQEKDVSMHIKNLWGVLRRDADQQPAEAGSSLLPLPNPYIVPGGRFREIYYWDSYFTMLGLKESGEIDMIENMVKNFAFLIDTYGHIPNGNRSYYLSRSQPPYFSLMVALLADVKDKSVYTTYLLVMEKEYKYWMEDADELKIDSVGKRACKMSDGSILNRYWDDADTPRPESYKEDYDMAEEAAGELAKRIRVSSPEALEKILSNCKINLYHNLRGGAASGWDFSSRWFADEATLPTIQTSDIVPVDLNCLLYALEMNIAKAAEVSGNKKLSDSYAQMACRRSCAILKYCWNSGAGFFTDYNIITRQQNDLVTAAGLFPLFVKIATKGQADTVTATTTTQLIKAGGLVTTTNHTGQQWDAPNGWAPLQWIAVQALKNYNKNEAAKDIAVKWLALNEKVYLATGKLMEKYNVEDLSKEGGGGEYPAQDGFGWTNGVYLALKHLYPSK
ncbi:alpha,alpha-trehalase [soil metagenome]